MFSRLPVLDFGGGLGSVYHQHKRLLPTINGLSWNIIEQGKYIEIGQKDYSTDALKFHETLADYSKIHSNTDIVLISSVLQYLEKPLEILKQLMELKPAYIIVDLTVISNRLEEDIIAVQKIGKSMYGEEVSYPCWMFSRQNFLKQFEDKYEPIIAQDSYLGIINHNGRSFNYNYFLLKRI